MEKEEWDRALCFERIMLQLYLYAAQMGGI